VEEIMKNGKTASVLGLSLAFLLLLVGLGFAETDMEKHKSCSYCGMNRGQFAQSRMLITYSDGSEVALCSLHCASVDLAMNLDKAPKTIQVADFNTKNMIDAEQAIWVIGGTKPGVMSRRAKWAFADKPDAEAFVKSNGGQVAVFEDAIKAAYEDMYGDTKMIRDKRKMMKLRISSEKGHSH
jgi:copper chaperone NosL